MPFVQRVVTPIYISRAKKPTRLPQPTTPTTTTTATSTAGTAVADSVRWHTPASFTADASDADATNTSETSVLPLPPPPPTPSPPHTVHTTADYRLQQLAATCDQPSSDAAPAPTGASSPTTVLTTTTTASTCVVAARTAHSHYHQHQQMMNGGVGGGGVVDADDSEFEAVTNRTLSNALRQLASLMLIANDIFAELHAELQAVGERTGGIRGRVERLVCRVDAFDPKLVAVRKYPHNMALGWCFFFLGNSPIVVNVT